MFMGKQMVQPLVPSARGPASFCARIIVFWSCHVMSGGICLMVLQIFCTSMLSRMWKPGA
jgi:hypothetical protein